MDSDVGQASDCRSDFSRDSLGVAHSSFKSRLKPLLQERGVKLFLSEMPFDQKRISAEPQVKPPPKASSNNTSFF